ncbi:MAG: hypothetical protein AB1635_14755 [Acidobacteriota bacterium]
MTDPVPSSELLKVLQSVAEQHGLTTDAGRDTLSGETDAIRSKWFLGGRKVSYRFSIRLDDAAHQATFWESAAEKSWGIPPPALTVETTSQRGGRVSATRSDATPAGGGTLDYGHLREAMELAVRGRGWAFSLERRGR